MSDSNLLVIDTINPNENPHARIEARREIVSELLLENFSVREIARQINNPETKRPFAISTIQSDIDALRKIWRKNALGNISNHVGIILAKLDKLEKMAWEEKRFSFILEVLDRKTKLLGLNAPDILLNVDWRLNINKLLVSGRITLEDVRHNFGDSVADEFELIEEEI